MDPNSGDENRAKSFLAIAPVFNPLRRHVVESLEANWNGAVGLMLVSNRTFVEFLHFSYASFLSGRRAAHAYGDVMSRTCLTKPLDIVAKPAFPIAVIDKAPKILHTQGKTRCLVAASAKPSRLCASTCLCKMQRFGASKPRSFGRRPRRSCFGRRYNQAKKSIKPIRDPKNSRFDKIRVGPTLHPYWEI